jgi:signal transduction histidine kinase
VVLYNPAAEQLFGFPSAEVLGGPLELILPDLLEQPGSPPAAPSGTDSPTSHWQDRALTCARSDGSRVHAEARLVSVETADGPFMTLILRGRSEERRSLAELSLLKAMALAIGTSKDLDSAIRFTLQQICEFTGWTAGESWLPDATYQELRRGPVWSQPSANLEEFHRASEAFAFRRSEGLPGKVWQSGSAEWIDDVTADSRFLRPEVARRCGLRAGFAIPVLAGSRVVAVIVFYHTDARAQNAALVDLVAAVSAQIGTLMQRKQAEDELLRHSAELARSNAELEQFAYVASHDLQEPLRMVASFTQLLERRYRHKLDDDAREFIGFAVEGVKRMQQLILDLLAFSRVRNRGEVFEMVDLDELLQDVLQDFAFAEAARDAQITWDPLPRLSVDVVQIRQVFQNLIGNALKFRRGEAPRIHVTAQQSAGEWVFACRDNGIGIGAEYIDRIFVIFQRLHSRAEYPGNGSGLPICKKIIERHGGRIWVESEPGQGSTFFFTLPVGAPAEGADHLPSG